MSVSGIESLGFTPYVAPAATATPTTATEGPSGPSFGKLMVDGLEQLEAMTDRTDGLAVKAATGDLAAIHDYTIAASETSVATQLTVAMRNKAVEAFTEIMRMQVG